MLLVISVSVVALLVIAVLATAYELALTLYRPRQEHGFARSLRSVVMEIRFAHDEGLNRGTYLDRGTYLAPRRPQHLGSVRRGPGRQSSPRVISREQLTLVGR